LLRSQTLEFLFTSDLVKNINAGELLAACR
jgi:hypothetical protein